MLRERRHARVRRTSRRTKSFVAPASPVFDTRRRIPPLVVAPPNGVAVAASAAGTSTAASTIAAAVADQSSHGIPSRRGSERARTRSATPRAFPISPRAGGPERNAYEVPATDETYAATSSICFSDELPLERRHRRPCRSSRARRRGRRGLRLVEVRPDGAASRRRRRACGSRRSRRSRRPPCPPPRRRPRRAGRRCRRRLRPPVVSVPALALPAASAACASSTSCVSGHPERRPSSGRGRAARRRG